MKEKGEAYLDSFADFVRAVLDDKYLELRYRIEDNHHLQKINKINPELLQKWQIPVEKISVSLTQNLIATDTDDPHLLLHCGKDVNSCLRWDGDLHECFGLLGCLLNGQTRLLAVVNDEGRICSRAIMRLLLGKRSSDLR